MSKHLNQLVTMLSLQEEINNRIHPQWREQNYPWHRAVWTECAELLDHYGWKWWKRQSPDLEQIQLELVDIWHFGLSLRLQNNPDIHQCAACLMEESALTTGTLSFHETVEALVEKVLLDRHFYAQSFYRLMRLINMSSDALFSNYVSKNVLNFFRQDHGYQTGAYRKIWNGKEDNEHLSEIMRTLDADHHRLHEYIYQQLEIRYSTCLAI